MDYPQSAAWERHVEAQVMKVFGPLQSARSVDEIDRRLANMQGDLEQALDEAFDRIYEQAIIFVLLFMMQEDSGYQPFVDEFRRDPRLASELGTQQARRVASEIADSTRRRVVEFRGRPNRPGSAVPDGAAPSTPTPEFDDFRDNLFGRGRAEAIGITETTEAISHAETQAASIVTNSSSPHALHGTWVTADDEKVCPICWPLHEQPQEVYTLTFRNGPPAHPRCRCRIRWAVRSLTESTVRPMNVARRMLLNEAIHMILEFDTSKHPRGPDGRFIGKLSGVDFGKWNMAHPSAKGAVKKIGELEAAGRAGDWDKFEKLMYKPKHGDAAKPNSYQKLVLKAQATILSKKGELDAKVAAKKAKAGKPAPAIDAGKGPELLAKANAELSAAGEAKVGSGETKGTIPATTTPVPETKGPVSAIGTGHKPTGLDKDEVKKFGETYNSHVYDDGYEDFLNNLMAGNSKTGPTAADKKLLATYQLSAVGADPDKHTIGKAKVADLTPSQRGEDYINDSSKGLSKYIGTFLETGRAEDYAPIIVDPSGVVLDGNHRHAAHTLTGKSEIDVLSPAPGSFHEADAKLTRVRDGVTSVNGVSHLNAISSRTVDNAVKKGPEAVKAVMDAVHPDDKAALVAKFKARGIDVEPPVAAATTAEMPTKIGAWEKVGGKLGTEVGGVYVAPDGVKHYVKTPDNPGRAHNENLAIQLYKATGAGVVDGGIVDTGDGKTSIATKWIDSAKVDWNDPAVRKKAGEDFAVHAWLNNWDAVGSGSENPMDNIRMVNGKLTLVDAGGSLAYSGMGGSGTKPMADDAPEWENLRNPAKAGTMSSVFGGMTDEELKASALKLKGMTDEKIKTLVALHAKSIDEGSLMADTLIKRRDAILKKAGVGAIGEDAPPPKPIVPPDELAQAKAQVKPIHDGDIPFGTAEPSKIPPPPKVTSVANAGAQKKFDAIAAAAATGDIAAVEAIATNADAKQTYAKKHHQYKQAVLAAMKGGAAPDDSFKAKVAAASAPVIGGPTEAVPAAPAVGDGSGSMNVSGLELAKATLPPVTINQKASPGAYIAAVDMHQLAAMGDVEGVKNYPTTGPVAGEFKDKLIAHFDKAELAAAKVNTPAPAIPAPPPLTQKLALAKEDADIIHQLGLKGDLATLKKMNFSNGSPAVAKYHKDVMAALGGGPVAAPAPAAPAPAAPVIKAPAAKVKIDTAKLPPQPAFLTSNVAQKANNEAATQAMFNAAAKGDVAAIEKLQAGSASPKVKAYGDELKASVKSQHAAANAGPAFPKMPDAAGLASTPHVVAELIQLQAMAKAGNVAGIKAFKHAGTKAGEAGKYKQALLDHFKANKKPAPLALPPMPTGDMDSFEQETAKGWLKKAQAGDLQGLLAGDPLGGIEGKAAKQYHAGLVAALKPPPAAGGGSTSGSSSPHGPMPEPINPLSGQQKAIANAAANGKYLPMLQVLSPDNNVNPKDREYAKQLYQWVAKKHGGEGPEVPQLGKKVKAPTQTVKGSYTKLAEAAIKPGAATKIHDWNVAGNVGGVPEIPDGQWAHSEDVTDISDRGSAAYNALPKHHQEVLHEYTGSEYGLINSQLRTLPPDKWGKSTRDAYDALHKGSIPLKKGLMLSRKFGSWDRTKGLEPGMVIHEGAVLSTSLTEAAWQGKVHMKITVGEGVKGIPAKHFSANDTYDADNVDPTSENEVLLPPGTRFVVTKRKDFDSHVELHVVALPN